MNCVNLHSMKPAKWLSSPRWIKARTGKVRTQSWRGGRRKAGVGRSRGGEEKGPCFPGRPGFNPSPRPQQKEGPARGQFRSKADEAAVVSPVLFGAPLVSHLSPHCLTPWVFLGLKMKRSGNIGEAGRPEDCIQIRMFSLWEEGGLLALPWGFSPKHLAWSVPCGSDYRPRGDTPGLLGSSSAPLELLDKGTSVTGMASRCLGGWAAAAQAAQGRFFFLLLTDPCVGSHFSWLGDQPLLCKSWGILQGLTCCRLLSQNLVKYERGTSAGSHILEWQGRLHLLEDARRPLMLYHVHSGRWH